MNEPVGPRLCVAFIDDDPQLLEGLRRMLRRNRSVWQMQFTTDPKRLLEQVTHESVDVVVTDMRMPDVNGAAVLRRVANTSPKTVRIILSGHAPAARWLQRLGPAHRFLSKPCDAERLETTITQACGLALHLSMGLADETGRPSPLPPTLYAEVLDAMERDATGEELQALFGDRCTTHPLTHIFPDGAAVSAWMASVATWDRNVAEAAILAAHGVEQVAVHAATSLGVGAFEKATRVAARVRAIARLEQLDGTLSEQSAAAGLFGAMGPLLVAESAPGREGSVRLDERDATTEQGARLAGALLHRWGLPDAISEAVAYCGTPSAAVSTGVSPLPYVHAAWVLERSAAALPLEALPLDWPYLERVNLAQRVPLWRAESALESQPPASQITLPSA
jgi:DNA-binding NarL/FixJ family response regulator